MANKIDSLADANDPVRKENIKLAINEYLEYNRVGTGTPEGVITANIGTVYHRLDGGASTSLYVKESGTNTNTGWVAK